MFDHSFVTEEISLTSWSTTSSDTAINDWPVEMEFDSNNLQPAVVLQRLSPSTWSSLENRESDTGSTDAIMQPVVMLERLPSLQVPPEISSNSDVVDQHISFQWTRTFLGPLPIMAESPQPSSITVSDNWSFQEMSATTTLQPVVILKRLPSPDWSFQQTTAVTQPVVVLQRLNIPIPHVSDNRSFQKEDAATVLKACSSEPTVVLQRLSPLFQHSSYSNFNPKEADLDSSQNFSVSNDTWSSSTGQPENFNPKEADLDSNSSQSFSVSNDTCSSSTGQPENPKEADLDSNSSSQNFSLSNDTGSSSTGQPEKEQKNEMDTFIKQPVIVLEQLPLVDIPLNEVPVEMPAPNL